MKPFPYQQLAIDNIWSAIKKKHNTLLVAACSAGKTRMFIAICEKMIVHKPDARILILSDRKILVEQPQESFFKFAPELCRLIGVCCSGINAKKNYKSQIIIGTRQTVVGLLGKMPPVNLIIVDEAHGMAIPKKSGNNPDQYEQIIKELRGYNNKTRLLGVTATPYRTGDGYIYGDLHAPELSPYFDCIDHNITVKELLQIGRLTPLVGKTAVSGNLTNELSNIKISNGDYQSNQLSDLMTKGVHIQSAVDGYVEHRQDYKRAVAYCVDIDHCEALEDAFNAAGIPATSIHSKLNPAEWDRRMNALRSGAEYDVFCSVAQLTVGVDVPELDFCINCRPTKSPVLYKQTMGRFQRKSAGKKTAFILDIVGNINEFGADLDNITVRYRKQEKIEKEIVEERGIKLCPGCGAELHPVTIYCQDCGFFFKKSLEDLRAPAMDDVDFENGTFWLSVFTASPQVHRTAADKVLLKISFCGFRGASDYKIYANLFFCFEDFYAGFAIQKGADTWSRFTDTAYPDNVEDGYREAVNFDMPAKVLLQPDGKYYKILDYEFEDK